MLNTVDVTFSFEFGAIDGRTIAVEIIVADQSVKVNPAESSATVKNIKLPTQINIKFSGKTLGKDTKIDATGNIVQDMYVKVTGIKVDNLKIPEWVVQKKLSYVDSDGKLLQTAYVGFNGVMTIDIPEDNVFSFYRRFNRDD